jgi:hypothetical protein
MANDAGTSNRILLRLSETRIRALRLCYTVKLASTTPGSSSLCARGGATILRAFVQQWANYSSCESPSSRWLCATSRPFKPQDGRNYAQPLIARLMLHETKARPPSIMRGPVAPSPILNYACKAAKFAVLPSSFRDDSLRNG